MANPVENTTYCDISKAKALERSIQAAGRYPPLTRTAEVAGGALSLVARWLWRARGGRCALRRWQTHQVRTYHHLEFY